MMRRSRGNNNAGFERASAVRDVADRRLVISACALEGAGKSDFAMTAPEPIYYFGIDPNNIDVVEKWQDKKEIHKRMFRAPSVSFARHRDDVKDGAIDAWDSFIDAYQDVVEGRVDVKPRTIVLDTATEFRELQLLAAFGKTTQIPPQLYTPINAIYQDLVKAAMYADAHLILLHRLKEKYEMREVRVRGEVEEKEVKVPGEWERAGYNRTGNLVQIEVHLLHDAEKGDELEERFGLKIVKMTPRPIEVGNEYWGMVGRRRPVRAASFAYLATLAYPDTEIGDWQ